MPLLKKKSHRLLEPPNNLEPQELVYQVRLTKEIFRDYQLYLKRINLYRKRVWTCKSTGKTTLTYEEALDSEKLASKKVQTLARELVAPALRIIQFSTLSLKDLADKIATELQNCFYAGAELYGKKDGELHPCKILKILTDGDSRPQYEVGFLDKDKEINENTVLFGEDLSWKKFPNSRNFLKSFIRDSTCHSIPWVVNDYLAKAHDITRKIPKELQNKYVFQNGELVQQRKQEGKTGREKGKRKRAENGKQIAEETDRDVNESEEEAINYPIEDSLLPPDLDDTDITQRPSLSRDFSVPMDCVGDLLMVWDFCTSFGRQLHLWRFSLEDFENAVCHKESNVVLIMEVHACLFRFLINERGDNFKALQRRSRKSKITLITWGEYLCDFLESVDASDLCIDLGTIRRGHYGLLDPIVKLKILREIVNHITVTSMFKGEIDELVEQRHALGAARREEALTEARQKREEKERSKTGEESNGVLDNSRLEIKKISSQETESSEDSEKKESTAGGSKMENGFVSSENFEKSEKRLMGNVYLRKHKRQMTGIKIEPKEEEKGEEDEDGAEEEEEEEEEKGVSVKKQEAKSASEDEKGTLERRGPEQRRQYYEREMEKIVIRTNPLGKDRDYNRYWWFRSNGRIFVEDSDSKEWGYYTSKEELDALMGSLNRKGERELSLHMQLEKFYDRICSTLQKRTKDIAHNIEMEEAVVRRSTRVRAPLHENPASAFLKYVNKWKED
ncbi:PREDICTED: DDT domain-containing protein DDB_G0282237-like isoform X2 [Camelina sativa]|uniref:DDT domain-containing protein DDB_G0282237-like isoform X2 n=1 Tax=Camelina sativa TaxID=90675 RepID=A0ABM0XVA0_CAMSA|nr:PREDICTED: DDT domain-containing protein DDB_G0282237-like isoform X2 [Camelina sativa]